MLIEEVAKKWLSLNARAAAAWLEHSSLPGARQQRLLAQAGLIATTPSP